MCKDEDRIRDLAELDQSISEVVSSFPGLWWGLYKECVEKGFAKDQALELVKTYIMSTGGEA